MHQPVGTSRKRTLGVTLIVVAVAICAVLAVREHRDHSGPVPGSAVAAPGPAPVPAAGTSTPKPQPGWTTLRNQDSGLSYQIPPGAGWRTNPVDGVIGTVTLSQGAQLNAYQCGNPSAGYYRGALGSAAAPAGDPALIATSVAGQAATQYYLTPRSPAPTVTVSRPQQVKLAAGGRTVTGALVRATSHQIADKQCLASDGEVDVLVLRLPDKDGILLVNTDTAGGPATPPPGTPAMLRQILATVEPIEG